MNTIRVGLIGAGRIGQLHAEHLVSRVPGAELVAIADINLEAAQKLGERHKLGMVTSAPQDLFDRSDIDAVLICSSTDTHAALIEQAAAAHKHIFCEKPIAHDLAKIDSALRAVQRAGVKLQIGFNRRFDANFKQVHDLIAAGQIGQPQILRVTSRDPAPPPLEYVKVSGGLFLDMTIHDFDMMRYLAGSEAVEIYATGAALVDPRIGAAGDIDTALITLRFENGAIGSIDNSRQAVYGYDQRVEAFGSAGAISVSNNMPHSAVISNVEGVHSAKPLYFFLERYTESFIAEMRAFISAIQNDTPTLVTGADGRQAAVMALAAQKSLRENRPVKLSDL